MTDKKLEGVFVGAAATSAQRIGGGQDGPATLSPHCCKAGRSFEGCGA